MNSNYKIYKLKGIKINTENRENMKGNPVAKQTAKLRLQAEEAEANGISLSDQGKINRVSEIIGDSLKNSDDSR